MRTLFPSFFFLVCFFFPITIEGGTCHNSMTGNPFLGNSPLGGTSQSQPPITISQLPATQYGWWFIRKSPPHLIFGWWPPESPNQWTTTIFLYPTAKFSMVEKVSSHDMTKAEEPNIMLYPAKSGMTSIEGNQSMDPWLAHHISMARVPVRGRTTASVQTSMVLKRCLTKSLNDGIHLWLAGLKKTWCQHCWPTIPSPMVSRCRPKVRPHLILIKRGRITIEEPPSN